MARQCETPSMSWARGWQAGAFACAVLALAACGTRLSDDQFVQAQQQQAGVPLPGASASAGPGTGPAPGGGGSSDGGTTLPGVTPTGSAAAGVGTDGSQSNDGGPANTASDVGVTPTTITIGNIVSRTNPFDPRAFVGPAYGIAAFVHWINAHGGVHGRQLVLKTCDDQGSGNQNVTCVHQLLDHDHVFALVSNSILTYSGANYVNSKGVPDVAGQPIDTAYDQYPHLWNIYGEDYPRNGKDVGWDGKLYGGTEVYKWFSQRFPKVPKVAGVVMYNQDASQRFGSSVADGLRHEGYKVVTKVVNFALPDYDSVAIDFKRNNVQYVYDTIDRGGNARLCKALDDNQVRLTAKVLTPQSWEQSVRTDYKDSPNCRNAMWATGMTRNYADTKYPGVAAFRQQMTTDGHGGADELSEWALEGWAGGQWFADAAASCGGNLTRRCVEAFINSGKLYDANDLFAPRNFHEYAKPHEPVHNCINVVRWSDSAGTWVTQVPDMDKNCFDVYELPYSP